MVVNWLIKSGIFLRRFLLRFSSSTLHIFSMHFGTVASSLKLRSKHRLSSNVNFMQFRAIFRVMVLPLPFPLAILLQKERTVSDLLVNCIQQGMKMWELTVEPIQYVILPNKPQQGFFSLHLSMSNISTHWREHFCGSSMTYRKRKCIRCVKVKTENYETE